MSTNLITDGGFEAGGLGWTWDPLTLQGVYTDAALAHTGNNVFYNGNTNTVAALTQTVATIPGQFYSLSFWFLGGVAPSALTVFFGGSEVLSLIDVDHPSWTKFSAIVQATTASTEISFVGYDDPSFLIYDDIALYAPTVLSTWNGSLSGDASDDFLTCVASQGTLTGLGGDDTLFGSGWADSLYGNAGNDSIWADGSSSRLDGGADNDTIVADGWGSTIIGGDGNDVIVANASAAVIDGGAGFNLITAGGWGATVTAGDDGNWVWAQFGGSTVTLGTGGNAVYIGGWGNQVTTNGDFNFIEVQSGGGNILTLNGLSSWVDLGLGGANTVNGLADVIYTGTATQYVVQRSGGASLLVTGPGGTDILNGVAHLEFADGFYNPFARVDGDLNGDYRADIVTQNADGNIWAMTSGGGWAQVAMTPGYQAVVTADLLGDGGQWVVGQAENGSLSVARTSGGAATVSQTFGYYDGNYLVVGVGDFDGDGTDSLLIRGTGAGDLYLQGFDGSLALTAPVWIDTPGTAWAVVGTGDFNGDANTDILFFNETVNAYWMFCMDGAAIQAVGSGLVTNPNTIDPAGWQVRAIGDLYGNGSDDIVWQNDAGELFVWQMDGNTMTGSAGLGNVGTWWTLLDARDLTGDGKDDLIFEGADGTLWSWTMNGNQIKGGGYLGSLSPDWQLV
jgi:hypothetical protein